MLEMKYVDSKERYHVAFRKLSDHIVELMGEDRFFNLAFNNPLDLEDAMIDSLGIEKEIRKVKGKENVSEIAGGDSYYLVEEANNVYKYDPKKGKRVLVRLSALNMLKKYRKSIGITD